MSDKAFHPEKRHTPPSRTMESHAPSGFAKCLQALNRVSTAVGFDLTAVKAVPAQGDKQLELLNELLRRINEDTHRTFAARLITRDWYQKATSWPAKVLSRPLNNNRNTILFICGIPRSGTTFMNELLAADPLFRILRHEDLDIDMAKAKRGLQLLFKEGYSALDSVHPLDSPPEDLQIMGQYVVADIIMGLYGSQYVKEMPEPLQLEIFKQGYLFERQVYNRLPIRPEQRFVIKSPVIHMMYFSQFQNAFDDYRMLLLVRDLPVSVLSTCHIFEMGLKYMKQTDPSMIGELVLHYVEGYISGLECLSAQDLEKFAFVDFHGFVKEPIRTIEQLYKWMNLDLNDGLRDFYIKRQTELESIHISRVSKPAAEYYNLDMNRVRNLDQRYAAIYRGRMW